MFAKIFLLLSVGSISRADWRPAIIKIDRPVLILCQAAVAAHLLLSIVPSTRVETFDDGGHALFVDDAARFDALLEDFVPHLPER